MEREHHYATVWWEDDWKPMATERTPKRRQQSSNVVLIPTMTSARLPKRLNLIAALHARGDNTGGHWLRENTEECCTILLYLFEYLSVCNYPKARQSSAPRHGMPSLVLSRIVPTIWITVKPKPHKHRWRLVYETRVQPLIRHNPSFMLNLRVFKKNWSTGYDFYAGQPRPAHKWPNWWFWLEIRQWIGDYFVLTLPQTIKSIQFN